MSRVICVGSTAKDIFFPMAEGEFFDTPEDVMAQRKVAFEVGAKYQVEDRYEAIGGVAANTSVGLARLGISVSCCGATGDDMIGSWIRDELQYECVDIEQGEVFPNTKSDLSCILVFSASGDRTIFYNRDVAEKFRVKTEKLSGFSWIFAGALNGEWESNLHSIFDGIDTFGAKFAFNPGQRNLKQNPTIVLDAVRRADVLVLNKDEAIEILMHFSDFSKKQLNDESVLLRALYQEGAKKIALTDGRRGAWGYDGVEMLHIVRHTFDRAIDATGAGDAFGSGFLAAEIFGKSLREALQWGMRDASSVIGSYGAISGLLQRDVIERDVDEFIVTKLDVLY